MIPYGKQNINQNDIDAVIDTLKSDFLTQGPAVPQFEQALCDYSQSRFAVAVNSATSALHIACQALGLSRGDWLWTSPITFVASGNCGLYCGAQIDFVDIDPLTNNMCATALKEKLAKAKDENKLPKIVMPVHLSGQSCDMAAIYALAQEYHFYIIEDASHAIGGHYKGKAVGCCEYSDISVFSFHPVKIITTAEGGAALTNTPELADKMKILCSHGITRDPDKMQRPTDGPWYYEQLSLGQNYRMTDIQAALGLSQLQRIDNFIAKRKTIVQHYFQLLAALPITLPASSLDDSAWHLFIVRLQAEKLRKSHRDIFCELRQAGIGVNLHYIPVYKQPYYQTLGFTMDYCQHAEAYYRQAISLPLFPDLSRTDQQTIARTLKKVLV